MEIEGILPRVEPKPVPKSNWPLLWSFFRGFKIRTIVTLLFLILARLALTLDPLYLKKIIDALGIHNGWDVILPLVIFYFGLKVATLFFELLRDIVFSRVEMGVAKEASERVFYHIIGLSMSFHSEQKTGALAKKVTRGSSSIQFILDLLVINILPTVVELILVTILLLKNYSPVFGLMTAGTVVFYTIFTIWTTEYRQKYRLKANLTDDEASAIQVDTLTSIETVKYFHNEEVQRNKFHKVIQLWHDLLVSSNNLFATISLGQGAILTFGLGVIFYISVKQSIAGMLTVGDLVLLTTYIVRLSTPIGILGFVYRRIKDGFADLDEMANILRVHPTVREPVNGLKIKDKKGEIKFDNIEFAYSGREKSLDRINLDIKAGEHVAIVGPSGAGKSTIVKMLFRFYDPTNGAIVIDGIDLRNLTEDAKRDLMTIVPQEPVLFNDTIGNNIKFGKPGASHDDVRAAAKLAQIDTFIESLPKKYDTTVGDRGIKLSGGEKQRVAIARAIIRNPKIVVFDEATSSLDTKSERAIQTALDKVAEGRTTVAIAHRLSTIVNSDRIYVLEKGAIKEFGKHDELLKKGGLYAKLWNLQSHAPAEIIVEEKLV